MDPRRTPRAATQPKEQESPPRVITRHDRRRSTGSIDRSDALRPFQGDIFIKNTSSPAAVSGPAARLIGAFQGVFGTVPATELSAAHLALGVEQAALAVLESRPEGTHRLQLIL